METLEPQRTRRTANGHPNVSDDPAFLWRNTATVYRDCVPRLCTATVYRDSVPRLCTATATVYRDRVPRPCTATVYRDCVPRLCTATATVYRDRVPRPCTATVYRDCVPRLCTAAPYCDSMHLVISPGIGSADAFNRRLALEVRSARPIQKVRVDLCNRLQCVLDDYVCTHPLPCPLPSVHASPVAVYRLPSRAVRGPPLPAVVKTIKMPHQRRCGTARLDMKVQYTPEQ